MKTASLAALVVGAFGILGGIGQAADNKADGSWTVEERGPHHRVWKSIHSETNKLGKFVAKTNSYTELQTGMHFQKDGQLVETEAEIELTKDGAAASNGPHKVNFAPNINTVGAIELTTPDGKRMRSHVLGLSYFDTATGKSALIAEIKDSIGLLTPPNQVIYPDAFTEVKADIRYTYTAAGFAQDIILRGQLPSPDEYELNGESTRLEILTEFVETPIPTKTEKVLNDPLSPDAIDETLQFGAMSMGPGIAFLMGNGDSPTNNPAPGRNATSPIPVGKTWAKMDARNFLVEFINYKSIESHLKTLPPLEAKIIESKAVQRARLDQGVNKRKLPVKREARATTEKLSIASLSKEQPGFLIDYEIVFGSTNFIFKGDTTYYVSGGVNLYGTITLEGNTVIKFAPTNSPQINVMDGLFDCKTDSYRPAVFTARDDRSVGELIGTNSVPLAYDSCFAFKGGTSVLSNVRFSYADWACSFWSSSSGGEVRDAQFVRCGVPINAEGNTVRLRNVLMTGSLVPLRGINTYTIAAENVTIDGADPSLGASGGSGTISFTNSIVVAVTNLAAPSIVTNNTVLSTNAIPGIFQTVGAGSYYLEDNSSYRDIGTTNINSSLLAGLRKKTTYPPIVLSNVLYTNDLTMSPQAQRDTDTPDLGYHYDPLDYALGAVWVTNATITIAPGTAIGTFSSINTYGFSIQIGAAIISEGEPTRLNYIVNYNTVQEQSNTNWTKINPISFHSNWNSGSPAPTASFRFTVWSMLSKDSYHFHSPTPDMPAISFQDCQIFSGTVYVEGPALYITNSLLFRTYTTMLSDAEFILRNSTFYGGIFEFYNWNANSWVFKDNLFAYTTNIQDVHNVTSDFNAFYNSSNISTAGASNVVLTNLTFQTGTLGNFYLATNNVELLNKGSTNANLLALYHFTTATNQVKETNSMVDIGFHYVAVGGDDEPIDTDNDGNPDYNEDSNGNGDAGSGETDWEDAFDLGLRVRITQPAANSTIP